MGERLIRARGALLAALSLGGCSLYCPTMQTPVILPEVPAHWRGTFPEIELHLEWPGAGDSAADLAWEASLRQVELRLPKRTYLPVVARPHLPRTGLDLPCAGAVFPLDLGPGCGLHASWARGPLAQLLLELADHGLDIEGINVPRLEEEMRLQAGEDPWNLDLQGIAASLASGQMESAAIRLLPLADLRLPAGPGDWFLESPLRSPCRSDAQGVVSLRGVSPGFHRLFELGGEGRVDLYLSDGEVLWVRRLAGKAANK
jgi:hypothetical protein